MNEDEIKNLNDKKNREKFEFLISTAIAALNREKLPVSDFIQLLISYDILTGE